MLKKKQNSLSLEIWKYFFIFSILILGFLWIFQVLFLDSYYKASKTKDIKSVGNAIVKIQSDSNFTEKINRLAFDKEVCIEIVDEEYTSVYNSSFFGKGCLSGKEKDTTYKYDFITSGDKNQTYEINNNNFKNISLVYAAQLKNNYYVFVNTSVEPIDSTSKIITKQLIIITIVILLLSFLVAYYMAKRLSKPIVKITKSAKKLGEGEFDTVFETDTNISELNELTNTLNYTRDELSHTEELRRDLMANVSHDLKTPLTMIKAYAEMCTDLHENNKEKQKEDMDTIVSEVDRLTVLVTDILTLSKMQSNIEDIEVSEFDIVNLSNDIIKKYNVLVEKDNYKFNVITNKNKILVNCDKKKIEQVIYNLTNNAINYTGEDNTVTIKITDNKDDVLVEVIDTGKGIKEEDLPNIWDRYYKNKKKHKRNLVGTGLGLSIVKSILVQHGYEYGVNSIKDKGTTFYFKIKKEKKIEN